MLVALSSTPVAHARAGSITVGTTNQVALRLWLLSKR
jgi:hypothetical protein